MTVSQKQLIANRQNALKSTGPKTETGKALASRNALKHGLLASEVVIDNGEGAENRQEFETILNDLIGQFQPVGSLEEMMVEKIATSYWRLRRAQRYEVGILRQKLDTASDQYDAHNESDHEIDKRIDQLQQKTAAWQADRTVLKQLYDQGEDLSAIYDRHQAWKWINKEILGPERQKIGGPDGCIPVIVQLGPDRQYTTPQDVRNELNEKGYSDDQIWQMMIGLCERTEGALKEIAQLEKQKTNNKLSLQRLQKTGALPGKLEMDNLLRYETAINRQMDQAIKQLERLQRRRGGEPVPPPVSVDVSIDR